MCDGVLQWQMASQHVKLHVLSNVANLRYKVIKSMVYNRSNHYRVVVTYVFAGWREQSRSRTCSQDQAGSWSEFEVLCRLFIAIRVDVLRYL